MSVIVSNPNSSSQNVIQATADVPDLTLRPFSDTQASPMLLGQNQAGTQTIFRLEADGALTITPVDLDARTPIHITVPVGFNNDIFQISDRGFTIFVVDPHGFGATVFARPTLATDNAALLVGFAGQTAPILRVANNAFAPTLDVGANAIGFFGTAMVAKQVGASAAGIAAIVDPNAKAAVAALQAALAAYGLVTSPA